MLIFQWLFKKILINLRDTMYKKINMSLLIYSIIVSFGNMFLIKFALKVNQFYKWLMIIMIKIINELCAWLYCKTFVVN